MAVFMGGGLGTALAYDQADDNQADRLLALQNQIGLAETFVSGHIISRKIGHETIEIDTGVNFFNDGITNGTNQLTTASSTPFQKAMMGLPITIYGHGQRFIEVVNADNDIEFSGTPIDADTDIVFTQPLGLSSFLDGNVDANSLGSASEPFHLSMEGKNVWIQGYGSRVIETYNSPGAIVFGGTPIPAQERIKFIIPVVMAAANRALLTASSQVIDSCRTPATSTAMVMRWRLGK